MSQCEILDDCIFDEDNVFTLHEGVDPELAARVVEVLPQRKTHILEIQIIEKEITEVHAKFVIAAKTKEEVKRWQTEYENLTKSNYNIRSTAKSTGKYLLFKQRLACQYNTKCDRIYVPSIRGRTKNTNCPSKMTITVHAVKKRYQGRDHAKRLLYLTMPCEIELLVSHNHSTGSIDSLRLRKVSPEVKDKLMELYHNGHNAGTALKLMRMEIRVNCDDYQIALADRNQCPNYVFCYYVYTVMFKKNFKPIELNSDGKKFLKRKLEKYNLEKDDLCAKAIFDEHHYTICICTPLMKRVHANIKAASELVFIESLRTIDKEGSRLFVLRTVSDCGGLPLGVIITSSNDFLQIGFEFLSSILGDNIFGGSVEGPDIIMTEDYLVEKTDIFSIWPKSERLLSTFPLLQTVWKWLTLSQIPQIKQCECFDDFKAIMVAKTTEDCMEKYKLAKYKAITFTNTNYLKYLEKYWNKRKLWALSYCSSIAARTFPTNIYDAAMKLPNDRFFDHVKNFNTIQMVDFILTKFEGFYERRLLDAANNEARRNPLGQKVQLPSADVMQRIQTLNGNMVLVPSENTENSFYMVHVEVQMCSCLPGTTGKHCTHIDCANFVSPLKNCTARIDNVEVRNLFYAIATNEDPPEDWSEVLLEKDGDDDGDTLYLAMHPTTESGDTNDFKTEQDTSNDSSTDDSGFQTKAEWFLKNITKMCTRFIKNSPEEVANGLENMYERMLQIKDPAMFAQYCTNFGRELQPTPKKKNPIRRRRKPIVKRLRQENFVYILPKDS